MALYPKAGFPPCGGMKIIGEFAIAIRSLPILKLEDLSLKNLAKFVARVFPRDKYSISLNLSK